jgi:hypothetical protein
MKPVDYVKALVLAFVILVVEYAVSYPVVLVYRFLIAPGHPDAFYAQAAAQWLVPWWVHIGGTVIFFFAGWLFTGRQRGRNAYAFVAVMCICYLAIDLAGFLFMPGFWQFVSSWHMLWVFVQFAAAFLGAWVELRSGEAPGSA